MITREDKLLSLFTGYVDGKDIMSIHKYTCNNCNTEIQITEEFTLRNKKIVFHCPKCGRHEEFDGENNI